MNKHNDNRIVRTLIKTYKKYPQFQCFVVDKSRNGYDEGRGADHSVIIARDRIEERWYQFAKIWGHDNEKRAAMIILIYEAAKQKLTLSHTITYTDKTHRNIYKDDIL